MSNEIVIQNAEEIATLIKEVEEKFNGKQISRDYDILFRKYFDRLGILSDNNILLNRYLSNTNIESNRYKISLVFKDEDDKDEIYKYLEAN